MNTLSIEFMKIIADGISPSDKVSTTTSKITKRVIKLVTVSLSVCCLDKSSRCGMNISLQFLYQATPLRSVML